MFPDIQINLIDPKKFYVFFYKQLSITHNFEWYFDSKCRIFSESLLNFILVIVTVVVMYQDFLEYKFY